MNPFAATVFTIFLAFGSILSLAEANPQTRQLQGGFKPITGQRFPDGVVRPVRQQQQDRRPRPPPRQTQQPQQPAARPQQRPRPREQQGPRQPAAQPVRPRQGPTNRRRPNNNQQRPQGQKPSNSAFNPARAPASLFVRPEFDVWGNPIAFEQIIANEEEFLPDFRKPRPGKRPNKRPSSGIRRPPGNLGPDLQQRLPIFGQPDMILQATEELRSRDVNQASILPFGVANAGILPLAHHSTVKPEDLGLFPPFAPKKS
jgi:hypothetical protein